MFAVFVVLGLVPLGLYLAWLWRPEPSSYSSVETVSDTPEGAIEEIFMSEDWQTKNNLGGENDGA